jgi:hypothetical protein
MFLAECSCQAVTGPPLEDVSAYDPDFPSLLKYRRDTILQLRNARAKIMHAMQQIT